MTTVTMVTIDIATMTLVTMAMSTMVAGVAGVAEVAVIASQATFGASSVPQVTQPVNVMLWPATHPGLASRPGGPTSDAADKIANRRQGASG